MGGKAVPLPWRRRVPGVVHPVLFGPAGQPEDRVPGLPYVRPGLRPLRVRATVFWPYLDFVQSQNNTDYPIKIVTHWYNNNVTVKIFGTKTDSQFREDHQQNRVHHPLEKAIYKGGWTAWPPAPERVTQYPITGFTVQTLAGCTTATEI